MAIVEAALPLGLAPLPVLPITTAEYPVAAKRPANSCLDCSKLASTFAVRLPHWRDGLKACIAELALHNKNSG
jgi:dTDP-4-dehydrorhamnose reductase